MKLILKTNSHDPDQIENLTYNIEDNSLQYMYNGKPFSVPIEDSLTSFVTVKEEQNQTVLEIINMEATGI